MRKTSLNASITGSMASLYGDKQGNELDSAATLGHAKVAPNAQGLSDDRPFEIAERVPII